MKVLTYQKKKKKRREEVTLTKLFEPCMLCTFSYIKAYIRFFVFLFSELCFWQVVDALELAQATMAKVYQNLSWAIAYNVVAIPISAGVLLPQYDFAMTPSLSGLQSA